MFFKKKKEEPHELIARKQYKKAIELLRSRVSRDLDNTGLRLQLAEVYLSNGQMPEAMMEFRRVASQNAKEGNAVKAIAIYKKMLQLSPSKEIESLLENLTESITVNTVDADDVSVKSPKEEPVARAIRLETKLFADLKPEEFKQIVSRLNLRHYDEDTVVVSEGDKGDSLFIVVQGEVRVLTKDLKAKEVVLANLGEGEFFGEVSHLTGKPRTATIITNTVSDLLELTKADYDNIIAKYPHVRQVVEEFHLQRAYKTVEAMIQSSRENL